MISASRLLLVACAFAAVVPRASAQAPATPPPVAPPATVPGGEPGRAIIERVLVRVNGEIFTQSQLTRRQIDTLRERELDQSMTLEQQIAEITPEVLVTVVDELLLVQQGRELGFQFSDEQFNSAIENIKKSNNLDDAGFEQVLKQEGLTREDLRQRFEQQYLIQGVQQREIGPSMTITLEEQRQYYKRNADQFMTPETVTLRELLVSVPTRTEGGKEVFSVADEQAARAEIDDFRTRLLAGEQFDALAKEHSDSATRGTGGLIGPVNVADLSPDLAKLLETLEPGDISEPVRVARGFQIFKLETRSESQLRPFDEVRSQIETAIRNERIGPETEKLLTGLRAQAVIEWKDEALRQLYEQEIAERSAS